MYCPSMSPPASNVFKPETRRQTRKTLSRLEKIFMTNAFLLNSSESVASLTSMTSCLSSVGLSAPAQCSVQPQLTYHLNKWQSVLSHSYFDCDTSQWHSDLSLSSHRPSQHLCPLVRPEVSRHQHQLQLLIWPYYTGLYILIFPCIIEEYTLILWSRLFSKSK